MNGARYDWDEHTLEVALCSLGIAGERGLRLLLLQLIKDLAIHNVAHLIVLLDKPSILGADGLLPFLHKRLACAIGIADITVYAFPAISTLALVTLSR